MPSLSTLHNSIQFNSNTIFKLLLSTTTSVVFCPTLVGVLFHTEKGEINYHSCTNVINLPLPISGQVRTSRTFPKMINMPNIFSYRVFSSGKITIFRQYSLIKYLFYRLLYTHFVKILGNLFSSVDIPLENHMVNKLNSNLFGSQA